MQIKYAFMKYDELMNNGLKYCTIIYNFLILFFRYIKYHMLTCDQPQYRNVLVRIFPIVQIVYTSNNPNYFHIFFVEYTNTKTNQCPRKKNNENFYRVEFINKIVFNIFVWCESKNCLTLQSID